MHVEADVFTVLAVAVALQRADLVEGDAQIRAGKGLVLVELQAVLVVEVQRPELAEGHGEVDFVRRVKPGQDGVRRFDEAAHPLRVARQLRDGQAWPMVGI